MPSKPLIRPSGADRLFACPGSLTLQAKIDSLLDFSDPSDDGDEMTWRGNFCHAHSANRLIVEFGAVAPDGLQPPVLPKSWQPERWDIAAADWYVDGVVADTPSDHSIFVEHRITVEFERFILSGQLDEYSVCPLGEEFQINDQKSGPNEVDHAADNWQLALYAVLLKKHIPTLKRGKLCIRQRAASEPVTTVDVDDLDKLTAFVEQKINAALDAYRELETGYKQCRLCPIPLWGWYQENGETKCLCPAFEAEIKAMKATLTDEQIAALKVTSDLKQLGDMAHRCHAIAGPVDRVLKAFKERLGSQKLTLSDGTVAEIETVPGRRSVTAPQVAFEFVKNKTSEDAAWRTLSMSLTSVEDELAATGMKRTSKKEESATSWIKDNLSHLIVRPNTKQLKFS